MKISISRSNLLPTIVIVVLLAAVPFAIAEFLRTGQIYMFSRRFLDDMVARLNGPGRLRFIFQPTVAILLGARDGVKDARAGDLPFLWDLVFHRSDRPGLLRSALASLRNLVAIAILLDVVSQLLILHMVNPCGVDTRARSNRLALCLIARTIEPHGTTAINAHC